MSTEVDVIAVLSKDLLSIVDSLCLIFRGQTLPSKQLLFNECMYIYYNGK